MPWRPSSARKRRSGPRLSVMGGRCGSRRTAPFSATMASKRAGPDNRASRSLRVRPVTSTVSSPVSRDSWMAAATSASMVSFAAIVPSKSSARTLGFTGQTRSGEQLLEHIGQDTARREVGGLDRGVDPEDQRYGFAPSVRPLDAQGRRLAWVQRRIQLEVEALGAVERESLRAHPFGQLAWEDAHADQVGAVDPLESPSDHRADAEQAGTLGGPVAR